MTAKINMFTLMIIVYSIVVCVTFKKPTTTNSSISAIQKIETVQPQYVSYKVNSQQLSTKASMNLLQMNAVANK